jgi:hypothetical protein
MAAIACPRVSVRLASHETCQPSADCLAVWPMSVLGIRRPVIVRAGVDLRSGRHRPCCQYQRRLVRRFGGDKDPAAKKKAITAIAHTLLKIAYQVLQAGTPYQEPGADFYTRRESPQQRQNYLERQLQNSTRAAPSPSARRRPPKRPAPGLSA